MKVMKNGKGPLEHFDKWTIYASYLMLEEGKNVEFLVSTPVKSTAPNYEEIKEFGVVCVLIIYLITWQY